LDTPVNAADTPGIDLTAYGRAKGSPSFMSPEQARGEWDRVTPASDIYSLGSTLFYVLTGKVPYDGKTGAEVVDKVKTGVFCAPRTVTPEVPAALDAICRKAMSYEAGDRYATAQDLANDLERWLADEPVGAWREPFAHRARRWARRHRTLVTATAATVVVGFVLLAIAGYRLDRKNDDLKQANEREVALRIEAEKQKELADERFQLALDSTGSTVTDIQAKLVRSPGTRVVRETLLKDAIVRLERLLERADQTREANRTKVIARIQLGDLYRDVEQNPSKAEGEYIRAVELATAMREQFPQDPDVALVFAKARHHLGRSHVLLGRFAKAANLYREASFLLDEIGPTAEEPRAQNLTCQAELALVTGDSATAILRYTEARTIWEHRDGTDEDAAFSLAEVIRAIGHAAERAGRYEHAIAQYTLAISKWSELQTRRPTDVTLQKQIALTHNGLAQSHSMLGNRQVATTHFQAFFDLTRTLVEQDPENGESLLELSIAYGGLALDAAGRFDLQKAEEHSGRSLQILERLSNLDANNVTARRNYATGLSKLAVVAQKRQKPKEAVSRFGEAITIGRGILQIAPNHSLTIADMAEWLHTVGLLCIKQLGDSERGLAALNESVVLWSSLIEADSTNLYWHSRSLESHRLLGETLRTKREFEKSGSVYRAGLLNVERLRVDDMHNPLIRRATGDIRSELFKLDLDLSRTNEAVKAAEAEIESLNKLANENPQDKVNFEALDRNHTFLATAYSQLFNPTKSIAHRRLASDACELGLKLDPVDTLFRSSLLVHQTILGEAEREIDPAKALQAFEAALAHKPLFPADLVETSILLVRFGMLEARAGDCCEMLNKPREALVHYMKALEHHQKVATIELQERNVPGILAYDYRRLAEIRLYVLDFKGALSDYTKAKEILDALTKAKDPVRAIDRELPLQDEKIKSLVKDSLAFVQSLPGGLKTLDDVLKQPTRIRLDAMRLRVTWLINAGDLNEAAKTAAKMAEQKALDGDQFARAAVEFSRLAAEPGSQKEEYLERAVGLLVKAKDAGYFQGPADVAWLTWEPFFDPLRKNGAFQGLVKEVTGRMKK
jgi:tetratricopeptide (TPR) repeat protein